MPPRTVWLLTLVLSFPASAAADKGDQGKDRPKDKNNRPNHQKQVHAAQEKLRDASQQTRSAQARLRTARAAAAETHAAVVRMHGEIEAEQERAPALVTARRTHTDAVEALRIAAAPHRRELLQNVAYQTLQAQREAVTQRLERLPDNDQRRPELAREGAALDARLRDLEVESLGGHVEVRQAQQRVETAHATLAQLTAARDAAIAQDARLKKARQAHLDALAEVERQAARAAAAERAETAAAAALAREKAQQKHAQSKKAVRRAT